MYIGKMLVLYITMYVVYYQRLIQSAMSFLVMTIIAITETHLDDSICDERLLLNGYHPPLRKDINRFGGGVALYISKHLKYVIRNDLCRSDIEIFWCEIHTSCDKFLLGVIYRPPQFCAEYWEKFSATMEQALDTEY